MKKNTMLELDVAYLSTFQLNNVTEYAHRYHDDDKM